MVLIFVWKEKHLYTKWECERASVYTLHASHPMFRAHQRWNDRTLPRVHIAFILRLGSLVYRTYSSILIGTYKQLKQTKSIITVCFCSLSLFSLFFIFFSLLPSNGFSTTTSTATGAVVVSFFARSLCALKLLVYFATFITRHWMMFIVVLPKHKLSRHRKKSTKTNEKFNITHTIFARSTCNTSTDEVSHFLLHVCESTMLEPCHIAARTLCSNRKRAENPLGALFLIVGISSV